MGLSRLQFGEFELDCDRFELLRGGHPVQLEKLPLELLILLVSNRDRLIEREEIVEQLWGTEVFVDSEHGINTAVRKVRQALRDSPERPRFIQTVTGKGYRFVADVTPLPLPAPPDNSTKLASASPEEKPIPSSADDAQVSTDPQGLRRRSAWLRPSLSGWLLLITCLIGGFAILQLKHQARPKTQLQPQVSTVAVLPLANLSGDRGQDYFADGMTDELITMLAKNSTLRVISRTTMMQFKDQHRPLREIAKAVGADGILEGSVSRSPNKMHMTLQLIQASDDSHLWAESYDRDPTQVPSLGREAAQSVADVLHRRRAEIRPRKYVNPQAHDAFMRGMDYWLKGVYPEAEAEFRRATELQPDYAAGWAGLGDIYGARMMEGFLRPRDALPKGEALERKAVQLDDSLPDAHLGMAATYLWKYDLANADAESVRTIALDPEMAAGHHLRSYVLIAENRMDEAREEERKQMELDPFGRPYAMTVLLIRMHEYQAAIEEAEMRAKALPNYAPVQDLLATAYFWRGMKRESIEASIKEAEINGDKREIEQLRAALRTRDYDRLLRLQLAEMLQSAKTEYRDPIRIAYLYAKLHRREEAVHFLQLAYEEQSPRLVFMQHEPEFDFLHSDPRYRSIVKQVGLPPVY